MIHVGKIARELREALGVTQMAMSETLGITNVHLCNIENEKSFPSQDLIDRYRKEFDIDLYVFAWCRHGELEKLPAPLRKPAAALSKAWEIRLKKVVTHYREKRA